MLGIIWLLDLAEIEKILYFSFIGVCLHYEVAVGSILLINTQAKDDQISFPQKKKKPVS